MGFRLTAGTGTGPAFRFWPGREVPDDHCRPIHALATIQPAFTDAERLALAGFLAGYRGLAREAYALDLRQFTSWCRGLVTGLAAVRRADIESLPGSWRPGAGPAHRDPAAVHHRRVLQVRG